MREPAPALHLHSEPPYMERSSDPHKDPIMKHRAASTLSTHCCEDVVDTALSLGMKLLDMKGLTETISLALQA